jgi:hypothetical protein
VRREDAAAREQQAAQEASARRKTLTGEQLGRSRVITLMEDDPDVITSAAPIEETLGKRRPPPPPRGGTTVAGHAPPPPPASARPAIPGHAPPPPPPSAKAGPAAATPPPPAQDKPAAPETSAPPAPEAPPPAVEAARKPSVLPPPQPGQPQPGQLASAAAVVPPKQPARPSSFPPKPSVPPPPAAAPVAQAAAKPEAQAPAAPAVPKLDVPAAAATASSPRKLLSETLPSAAFPSPAKTRPEPAVEVVKKPSTTMPAQPPAAEAAKKPSTTMPTPVPAQPPAAEAAKKPSTTMPTPVPAPATSAAKLQAGRSALAALKPDAPQPAPRPAEEPAPKPTPSTPPPGFGASLRTAATKPSAPIALKPSTPPPAPAPSAGPPRIGDLALEDVEAFSDLPEDVQSTLATAAIVTSLGPGESRTGFGAALVVTGEALVAAASVTVPAQRLAPRDLVPARGTVAVSLPLCVLGGSSGGTVALFPAEVLDAALKSCPWVLDEWRTLADRLQARAGLTLGRLAQLDQATRDRVAAQLTVRVLQPGEALTEDQGPLPGIAFVGAGTIELLDGDPPAPAAEVRPGELLFPEATWAGAPAPMASRAGTGGAILLVGDRKLALVLAEEIPLIGELLAGG